MLRLLTFLFAFILIIGCSSTETPTPDEEGGSGSSSGGDGSGNGGGSGTGGSGNGGSGSLTVGLTFFDSSRVFTGTVTETGEASTFININDQFGMPIISRMTHIEKNIGVFQQGLPQYHYVFDYKNTQLAFYENDCGLNNNDFVRSTYDQGFMYKLDPDQFPEFVIYKEDSQGNCSPFASVKDVEIGRAYQLWVGDNHVFMECSYSSAISVYIFDKTNGNLIKRIDHPSNPIDTLIDEDQLYVISFDNQGYSVNRYAGPQFNLVSTQPFVIDWLQGGLIDALCEAYIEDNKIIAPFPTSDGPGAFGYNPAIYNLATGQLESRTDLAQVLFDNLQPEYNLTGMRILGYNGIISEDRLVFTWIDSGSSQWGIAFANFQGDIEFSRLIDLPATAITLLD